LREFVKEKEIITLKTFKKFTKMPAIGSFVTRTSNTTNVEGLLYLMSDDYQAVTADRDKVVTWQRHNQLFRLDNTQC